MSIAKTVESCLERYEIPYSVISHTPTMSCSETAKAAAVPAQEIAKAVVLGDDQGYVMAVVPGDAYVDVHALSHDLGRRHLRLVAEEELPPLFKDCALGAIPPLGSVYGMETIVDEHVLDRDEICFISGDHDELIRVTKGDFLLLVSGARRGHVSRRPSA